MTAMAVEVALAMLQREGLWLMQLRDEIPTIVAPGCWGRFGAAVWTAIAPWRMDCWR